MKAQRKFIRAFTMIELLTVIAIIGILAALLFPVFGAVRRKVRQSTCMTQLHEIGVDMKLYHTDNSKYPASLLGFAQAGGQFYDGTNGPVTAIDQLTLYRPLTAGQKYTKDKALFLCPDNKHLQTNDASTVVYPPTSGVNVAGQQVFYTPVMHHSIGDDKPVQDNGTSPVYVYKYDSYDSGPQVDNTGQQVLVNGNPITELHYSLDWTGLVNDQSDPPNQLKFANPPEDTTVVTWCTYHAALEHSEIVPVLMLNGSVKAAQLTQFIPKGPLNFGP